MIVDSAIYVDGRRSAPRSLEGTHDACHDRGGFAWIGLYEPTEEEFASVTGEFELHSLAVEDAVKAHQRPKVEHYGDAIFVVLKSAAIWRTRRRWSLARSTHSSAQISLLRFATAKLRL